MKHLKIFEDFDGLSRHQRNYQRKKAEFDAMSDKDKKKSYDANTILRLMRKNFPTEKFSIQKMFHNIDNNAKAVFMEPYGGSGKYLNYWNKDSFGENGVKKEFVDFLHANKLDFHWDEVNREHGIMITPKDFTGHYMYYGSSEEPKLKIANKNYDEIKMVIQAFKEYANLDVVEADNGFDYNDEGKDRYEFDTTIDGMNFRVYVMKTGRKSLSYKDQILRSLNKIQQSLKRHEASIKEVYEYCKKVADGPVWTLAGGGAQLQQFYGDDHGYMATLYLDMEDADQNDKPGARNDKTLAVEGSRNDPKFVNFKSKTGIRLLSHKEIWGDRY